MPLELRAEDEAVEAVVLRVVVPDADERFLELLLDRREVVLHAGRGEAEVADAHRIRGVERLHLVADFVPQHIELPPAPVPSGGMLPEAAVAQREM